MTGLHPHDPGCHRASAEVSSSKTLSAHQLQAAAPQRSLPFDLILSGKVCSPFWELAGRGVLLIREYKLLCCHCMDITWQSLNSHTPFFFFKLFSKRVFFFLVLETNRCEANSPGDGRVVFKALQQHVIMSIYISARGRIQHAAASACEYQTCVKLKRRRQKKPRAQAAQLFLLNCMHLHGNDHLWRWKVCRALIRLKR